jgi:hypothetical protein
MLNTVKATFFPSSEIVTLPTDFICNISVTLIPSFDWAFAKKKQQHKKKTVIKFLMAISFIIEHC